MLVCEIQKDLRTDTLVSLGSEFPHENTQPSEKLSWAINKYRKIGTFQATKAHHQRVSQ